MYRGKRISVVIPCHNEEDGIAAVMAQMPPIIDEVVVVDNNSTDRTAEVATAAGARVVTETRKGYGYAHKAGYAAAKGDIIVTMDGDGTYPPSSIELCVRVLITEKIDFMTASRWRSKSDKSKSALRLIGNFVLSSATMALFRRYLFDSQSGMWVFRRDALPGFQPTADTMALSQEIKILAFTNLVFWLGAITCGRLLAYVGDVSGLSK